MLTTEKILRYVSSAIVLITVVFSVSVVTREIIRPKDPFERIVADECNGKYIETEKAFISESDLGSKDSKCVLIPGSLEEGSPFVKHIFQNGRLSDHHYLFRGEKGVLLRKAKEPDFKSLADSIYQCLYKNSCSIDPGLRRTKLTATFKLIDNSGDIKASITFDDEVFSQILKNSSKLLREMIAVKNYDIFNLRLITVFHLSYAFIENKDPEYISSLMKRGIDGLYLKSRGAKIRLLPHEYNDNPVAVISRKGRQYGLERDEITKDEASVYMYRTIQYASKNESMIEWLGRYSTSKSGYSDALCSRLISKQIINSADRNGLFEQETDIRTGESENFRESMLVQFFAASSLFRYGEIMDDEEFTETASKATVRLLKELRSDPSVLDRASINRLLEMCLENCGNHEALDIHVEEAVSFIQGNPVYAGLIINGLPDRNDASASAIISESFKKFESMGTEEKIRYLGYLFTMELSEFPESRKLLENILESTTEFILSVRFEDKGFPDFRGGIGTDDRFYPGILLTAVLANGLSNIINYRLTNPFITDVESEAGNFLRYAIVTDDDFGFWSNPTAKVKVQGGLRSHLRSDKVRLINSSVALHYFLNRIDGKRDR